MISNINKNSEILQTDLVCSISALKMLKSKRPLTVHSVFYRGANLTDEQSKELIYVGPNYPGMMTTSGMMLDKNVYAKISSLLKEGQRVQLKNDQLIIYTRPQVTTIAVKEIKTVDLFIPSISENDLNAVKLREKLEKLEVIEKSGFKKNKDWLNILHNILEHDKIQEEDVLSLIGAGVGLTPSGDDFLQGAILLETALSREPKLKQLVEQSLEKRSTTAISVSYYALLFKGTVNAPWQALLQAVKDRNEDEVMNQLQNIQQFGHTSGNDLLVGAWTYLKMNQIG